MNSQCYHDVVLSQRFKHVKSFIQPDIVGHRYISDMYDLIAGACQQLPLRILGAGIRDFSNRQGYFCFTTGAEMLMDTS